MSGFDSHEQQLVVRAMPYLKALAGHVPDRTYLAQLARREDVDLATMLWYQALRHSHCDRAFIQAIEARPATPPSAAGRVQLIVIPALFYRERPEAGGDGAQVLAAARACGIPASLAPTHSKGGLQANIPILLEILRSQQAQRIWLLSLSKGAAELRYLLHRHGAELPLSRIEAWLNVGGLPHGCQIVDHMLRSPMRRLKTRALCRVLGVDYHEFAAFGTANPAWHFALKLPPTLQLINVVGIPLARHVQRVLRQRYRRLAAQGPNDGMVLLPDAIVRPGYVYPIWGADHFFQVPRLENLLYRLFDYLLNHHARCTVDAVKLPCRV